MRIQKKSIRLAFRTAVFKRAKYRCEYCGKPGHDRQSEGTGVCLDSHHIISRTDMPWGGYVAENGISLCDECHLKAEVWHCTGIPEPGYSPEELFAKIDSSLDLALEASEQLGPVSI